MLNSENKHPLDALQIDEIESATSLAKEKLSDKAIFYTVALDESHKSVPYTEQCTDTFDRKVRLNGLDNGNGEICDGGFEAVVDLNTRDVQVARITKGQAPIGYTDVVAVIRITKADARWQEAMRLRGITNFDLVQIDPWPTGGYQHPSIPGGHRAMRAISFAREDNTDNGYARPIQGLISHVDLTLGKVAHLEDHGVVTVPPESGRYDAAHQNELQQPLSNLSISQPDGPGFQVTGNFVSWRNWQFRVTIHPINGLVLHKLSYRDGDRIRPILNRAALSDMVVPYGDTDPMHMWKHVLDAGEASLGNCTNSLVNGCDCLGEIRYIDHVTVNPDGSARRIAQAICLHEEDYGILWKHRDGHSSVSEVRRSRRMVVSNFCTIGNYEYGFYWYLYLDGSIQMEVKLTGIVGVSAVEDGAERPEFAPLIAPNLASPIHQHLFCFRLDFDVDGGSNTVYEVNTEPLPISEENPDGTAFAARSSILGTELEARRYVNAQSSRHWKVVNPNQRNRLGQPVAYKLVPNSSPVSYASPHSQVSKRTGFAQYNLWVTPYDDGQLHAAGDYPHLNPGGDGLPEWTKENREIVNKDVVVWHTFGVTHVPRPEDWPVMPVEYCGFSLQPVGFFDRNPAINLPPEEHCSPEPSK